MKPNEFNDLVNSLLTVYLTYGKTQQLRTHIAKTLQAFNVKPEHKINDIGELIGWKNGKM